MIDRAILHMVVTGERAALDFEVVHFDDFAALWRERQGLDARLSAFAEEHDAAWLAEKPHEAFRRSRGFMMVQLFNHQTHHRSQVTCELHKLGLAYGCTDMPYNPYLDA
jgi:DHA1 family bicyclomycin/chloramphenicol resistance-like MFS transporter